MLKLGKIVCFIVALAAINGCKKDPKIENLPITTESVSFNCGRSRFLDTINVSFNNPAKIYSSISGNNSIYVATQGSSFLEVVKMDCDANFTWKKNYNYGNEKVVHVSSLGKFDDFYVLTATENFTTTGGIDTVKAWVSYSENVSPNTINCDRSILAYGFNPKFITDEAIIPLTNYSKLYKYDGAGNLQWQKNLNGNYYDNVGLVADTNSNIYVLTVERKAYAPFEVFTFTTSVYPAYAMPLDSNGFSVTKIDQFGNQVSSYTMNKVYSTYAGIFNPALSISSSNVNVICDRDICVFDMNLNFINKISPLSLNCVFKKMTPISNPYISNSYFQILANDGITSAYLFEKYDGTNKQGTNTYLDQQYVTNKPCMDVNRNIYFGYIKYFSKYDQYGSKLYNKDLPINPVSLVSLTSKLNQVYLFYYDNSGKLFVVKPDAEGNY